MTEIAAEQRADLERSVAEDPGATGFSALAELERRSGRVSEAEEMLRRGLDRKPDAEGARLVLALCLIDLGRVAEAREELESVAAELLASHALPAPAPAVPTSVSDSEFDAAFADVSTDVERIVDPNRVAEEAVSYADGAPGERSVPSLFDTLEGSAFTTSTMADVLENQGDVAGAARVRAVVGSSHEGDEDGSDLRARTIATLQRWLVNLRGDRS